MKYLVTGATGHLGRLVMEQLLELADPSDIAISVRDTSKADDYAAKGIEVRQGDFDDPVSLNTAFEGVERLLIISTDGDNDTRIRQHTNAVQAAKAKGVKFIAYTSVGHADESDLFLAVVHKTTEALIKESGISYTFLRNNWYLENEAGSILPALEGNPWISAAGKGHVGWALRKDYAEAAAKVLVDESYVNRTLELSGPARTYDDLAKALSDLTGKSITITDVSFDQYHDTMASFGLPDFVLDLVTQIQKDIYNETLYVSESDFEDVLGHPVTPLEDALKLIING